jgi:hypothetical protein
VSAEAAVERPVAGLVDGGVVVRGSVKRQAGAASSSTSIEGRLQVLIMLAIGMAAGAGSFTHVHDVASSHGQAGWLAWADAVVLELMSIASGLELRRRKRAHYSTRFPAAVMGVSVVLSLGAQVVEAEPSVIGWIAAAIPALGFLVMVKIALARAGSTGSDVEETEEEDAEQTRSSGGPDPELRPSVAAGVDLRVGESDPVVQVLIPAARAAAESLHQQGRRVTRKALADVLRADGYGVSNARASELLRELKPELGGRVLPTGFPGVVASVVRADVPSSGG